MSHDRWLVSYADFITLLFAFFVVMFAVSQVDANKLGRFSESVRHATRYGAFEGHARMPLHDGAAEGQLAFARASGREQGADSLVALRNRLEASLGEGIASGRIEIHRSDEGLVIRFREAAFFDVGSASVRVDHRSEMVTVARALRAQSEGIRIEGHTDPTPIHTSLYRSNWDLSAARAARVLEIFDTHGVSSARMSVAGFADQRPVTENLTSSGRRQNRRVDVVVLRHGEDLGASP